MKKPYFFYYTKKDRKSKGVILSFFIFCAFTCAVIAPFLLQGKTKPLLSSKEYYLLSFYEGKDATGAKQAADALSLRGGAGTIIEAKGTYNVYACAYAGRADAESVARRIKEAGGACAVKPLTVPSVGAYKNEEDNQALLLAERGFTQLFTCFTGAYKNAEGGKELALIFSDLSAVRESVWAMQRVCVGEAPLIRKAKELLQASLEQVESLMNESTRAALSLNAKRCQLALLFGYREVLLSLPIR